MQIDESVQQFMARECLVGILLEKLVDMSPLVVVVMVDRNLWVTVQDCLDRRDKLAECPCLVRRLLGDEGHVSSWLARLRDEQSVQVVHVEIRFALDVVIEFDRAFRELGLREPDHYARGL